MAVRARDFAIAHPIDDPNFTLILGRLDTAVAHANQRASHQGNGHITERAAITQRRELKSDIRSLHLRRLITIGNIAAETHRELSGFFVMPDKALPNKEFLVAARNLVAAGLQQLLLLTPLGVDQKFFDQTTAYLDQFEGLTTLAHGGRSDHVAARAEMANLARMFMREVRLLTTFYKAQYPQGSEQRLAWESASNVVGPFRHAVAEEVPTVVAALLARPVPEPEK